MKTEAVVAAEEVDNQRETRRANRRNIGAVVADVLIAILPMYFIVFAVLCKIRDGTLASSYRNEALFKMAALNPTIFPIIFGLIVAKCIKAAATWRLEKGATVGHIQLLLGSRSLVSSLLAPWKLRTMTFFVPLVILLWIMNPIGGQAALRVVSKASNFTIIEAPFVYVDTTQTLWTPKSIENPSYNKAANAVFNMGLVSPTSSKNGTQDVFGNIQIPMLENMRDTRQANDEGWYYTAGYQWSKQWEAAVSAAADLPAPYEPQPIYASLLGLAWKRNDSLAQAQAIAYTGSSDSTEQLSPRLEAVKQALFGSDVINIQSEFNLETSYIYTDCTVNHTILDKGNSTTLQSAKKTSWSNSTATVGNGQGLTIAYDKAHNINSSLSRRIGFESWAPITDYTQGPTSDLELGTLTIAWCNMTTTYIEAQVVCVSENNCTVYQLRESTKPHFPAALTALDGITMPDLDLNTRTLPGDAYDFDVYKSDLARTFLQDLVDVTGDNGGLQGTPLEAYFVDPVQPFRTAVNSDVVPIYSVVNDTIFSQRLSQLINTYLLIGMDAYTVTGGLNVSYAAYDDGNEFASTLTSPGQMSIEKAVLRCHTPFFAVLVVTSILLCALGMTTAYFDASRKGPDVLDDFVNSIRHSPYVHVEQGPSMEDGQDKARRLKNTIIQMGDVRPDDAVGYVAIGTPSERQPVARLDHRREYV